MGSRKFSSARVARGSRSRLPWKLAVTVTGFAVLAGCAQGHPAATGKTPGSIVPAAQSSPVVSLPVMSHPQNVFLDALAHGNLVFSGGCFFLMSPGSSEMDLVWPYRYHTGTGAPAIYNASGVLVARPGDKVLLGGGGESLADIIPGSIANTRCLAGAKTAWFISGVAVSSGTRTPLMAAAPSPVRLPRSGEQTLAKKHRPAGSGLESSSDPAACADQGARLLSQFCHASVSDDGSRSSK